MINRLVLPIALNRLSIGQVSFNILRELYRRKIQCVLFPIGNVDLSAYKVDPTFGAWISHSVNTRYTKLDRKLPSLRIWHINQSESKLTDRQFLFTFHETDSPTNEEVNLVNQQEHTFFSSSWSVDNFATYGANNVSFVPLGLDSDFEVIPHRLVSEDITHWILVGKWEKRKNSELIVKTWIKHYANNPAHQLTLCVDNPFYQKQTCGFDMNDVYCSAFQSRDWQKSKPFNVNVLPPIKTNVEMNQLYNSADIDLSGFSRAEGVGIPSFTVTALGKWSIVTNCTGHKDWATEENAILVEPNQTEQCYDGVFFNQGQTFSQGNNYLFTEDQLFQAMKKALSKAKTPNPMGRKLSNITYQHTVDEILKKIE